MTFEEMLDQAMAMLQRRGRVTYRALTLQFSLDDDHLEALKDEILYAHPHVVDDDGRGLIWTGEAGPTSTPGSPPAIDQARAPLSYTPSHLAEKILTSKSALEGERKQVTVLFADLKGSMELLADRDAEEARQLLDPVLTLMMDAVHHYEETVNQVMGDGIMALFGAPLAHDDHAVRACYAALRMQDAIGRYAAELRQRQGLDVQIRVGLNSGAVVVRSIGSDLHMDYTAVGQTTHLAARLEQLARPGTTLLTGDTLRLVEGSVEVNPLGAVPVKGLQEPIAVYELRRAGPLRLRLHAAAAARGLTRFVGRAGELDQLHHALGRASGGHGQVVVVGEPGVGKSRLVWEVTHSPRVHGWLVLQAGSVSYGKATSYLPVIDLLKSYFAIDDRGVFDEGDAHGHEAIRIAEALDHPYSLIWACLGLAYLNSVRGELSQAARLLERAIAQCREWNITFYTPIAMASLGHVYAWSGCIGESVSVVQQALAAYESARIGIFYSLSVVQLGEAYLLADQVEDARACADRAVRLTRERGERGHEAWALRLLGEMASHRDRPDVAMAEGHFGAAMALASELGMRPLAAHCHLGLGTLYAKIGRLEHARAELSTTMVLYRAMEMTFWLPQMEAVGAQVEGR